MCEISHTPCTGVCLERIPWVYSLAAAKLRHLQCIALRCWQQSHVSRGSIQLRFQAWKTLIIACTYTLTCSYVCQRDFTDAVFRGSNIGSDCTEARVDHNYHSLCEFRCLPLVELQLVYFITNFHGNIFHYRCIKLHINYMQEEYLNNSIQLFQTTLVSWNHFPWHRVLSTVWLKLQSGWGEVKFIYTHQWRPCLRKKDLRHSFQAILVADLLSSGRLFNSLGATTENAQPTLVLSLH